MQLSYWEYKTWLCDIDFTIVGSGIVGLTSALFLKKKYPMSKIMVLERGVLPQGASTKNAGFACFGSISEILSDLENHTEQEVIGLVQQRFSGIKLLRELLGDAVLGYQKLGGHEIFLKGAENMFEECFQRMDEINSLLRHIFGEAPFVLTDNVFGFQHTYPQYITHQFEGQIDTGKLIEGLLLMALKRGIKVLNGTEVTHFEDSGNDVHIMTNQFELTTGKLLIATNGLARQFLQEDITPARAQVLITKPLTELKVKGTFHFDSGYYYFRNVDNRILFGGGRNLDFEGETSTLMETTQTIQSELERLLSKVILPNHDFEIERRWSGIMGLGTQKKPIVKPLSDNVFCGVRLGGMGIAIGSLVGKELSEFL